MKNKQEKKKRFKKRSIKIMSFKKLKIRRYGTRLIGYGIWQKQNNHGAFSGSKK